jgi:hypothetical protein
MPNIERLCCMNTSNPYKARIVNQAILSRKPSAARLSGKIRANLCNKADPLCSFNRPIFCVKTVKFALQAVVLAFLSQVSI